MSKSHYHSISTYRIFGRYPNGRFEHILIAIHATAERKLCFRTGGWDREEKEYKLDASPDFLVKTALFIITLMPIGVYADALEEEFPNLNELANYLRKIEQEIDQNPSQAT